MDRKFDAASGVAHFLLNSNVMNKAVWAFNNVGSGKSINNAPLVISQKTLDMIGFDLVRMYTDDMNIGKKVPYKLTNSALQDLKQIRARQRYLCSS